MTALVEAEHLTVHFVGNDGRRFSALDDVSLAIEQSEVLGVVGESGCGKSTLGRVLLRLLDADAGSVRFDDHNLTGMRGEPLRRMRKHMQMVFQDAGAALNPKNTIDSALHEALIVHELHAQTRPARVRELLAAVGLSADVLHRYPHELSGGQKQRVGIARALAVEPRFVVLDEPVSALDASVRAQVMNLLADLKDQFQLTALFISHDLAMVRQLCARTVVMYLGRVVEEGPTEDVLRAPLHPYTRALRASVPEADPAKRRTAAPVTGEASHHTSGCRFRTRCVDADAQCLEIPALVRIGARAVACHKVKA